MRVVVDHAFKRGGAKVWRRIVQERIGAVESTTAHVCFVDEIYHSFVNIALSQPMSDVALLDDTQGM